MMFSIFQITGRLYGELGKTGIEIDVLLFSLIAWVD